MQVRMACTCGSSAVGVEAASTRYLVPLGRARLHGRVTPSVWLFLAAAGPDDHSLITCHEPAPQLAALGGFGLFEG